MHETNNVKSIIFSLFYKNNIDLNNIYLEVWFCVFLNSCYWIKDKFYNVIKNNH